MNELERVEIICYFTGWDEVAYWNHYQAVQDYYLRMFSNGQGDKIKKIGAFQSYFSKQFIKRDLEILEKFFIFDKWINEMVFRYENIFFVIKESSTFERLYKKVHLDFLSHRINFQYVETEKEETTIQENIFYHLIQILWQLKKNFKG